VLYASFRRGRGDETSGGGRVGLLMIKDDATSLYDAAARRIYASSSLSASYYHRRQLRSSHSASRRTAREIHGVDAALKVAQDRYAGRRSYI